MGTIPGDDMNLCPYCSLDTGTSYHEDTLDCYKAICQLAENIIIESNLVRRAITQLGESLKQGHMKAIPDGLTPALPRYVPG
jgi:hypothetical protein